MAGTPSSTQFTSRSFDARLSAAFLSFAPKYMKDQLELLAQECDERLERKLLPRLQAILRDIDRERDAFEEHKRDAARGLRSQLNLHQCDAAAVDDAIGQLQAVVPRYLALLPSASSLALPVSIPTSLPATGVATSLDRIFDTTDADKISQTAASPVSAAPESSNHNTQCSNDQANKPCAPATEPLSLDSQVQAQVIAENSVASCSPKRSRLNFHKESDTPSKRQRIADEDDTAGDTQPKIERRVAFPNLKTGECIFRHAGRKGFFVVRCDYCQPGIFTEPPLLYNRALRHFQKHVELASDKGELTNEAIFERFSFQVDGGELASKYWIREHLGAMPHTFSPTGSSKNISQANDAEAIVRKHQEIDDDFSPPLLKLRRSACDHESDSEEVHEKPRRTRRNVPRPDYAEMVANKDPWNAPESDTEKPAKAITKPRSIAPIKRRLTKPGLSSSIKLLDSKKPFGYMSDPWPRRSAPR
ncbi:hypothetical protein GGR51DRAFT_261499 [Nemania sp. FL0031]|nr:hypothetical protein GGR51DRAFT_261499 [Nemania sp. FL0031]